MAALPRPEIVSETFGNPADPAILLIMGAMASMLWWPEAFCRRLAGRGGRFVIRYDNRDTGLSTKYTPGEPPYTFEDMVEDAVRVLDDHGVAKAHVVGMSMGGMIAQIVALKHPERVNALTVISSSPLGVDTSGLPGTSETYREHSAQGAAVDWSNREQVLGFMVKDARALGSTRHPFDEARTRAMIEMDYDRSGGLASATNHFLLKGEGPKRTVRDVTVPLLVIHGTTDPIFPIEHGEALAGAVPGARLVRVEGGGHELHRDDWRQIIEAVATHP
ncbi:alpha/beta hydrolase [Mesorhizobium sp. M1C.F.Ca.ET.193.01.1.1]|uniref:alpha/beta fold hydrolase n=1 Tax=unclassified Mesorhizobium TaxID=325217 RepID=UPI000FD49F28|nr:MULTISPECIES: alpha/beta hydrolase [unclassified Mesorhizobium]TGT04664.1 alpha/beta hydrolase [bacterium M00.F.Ca.ET.177.01.1.1]TGQ57492.1 alpha/beta hydrolase [Mesorhizobium sp. M1C.F.Ca.ET.210.01.1.1]TGQ75950.1 alpha/beta hydrolase [Mesorhizobium sp. M1C.F.Ca.ET.212.01.1.1]TGR14333.1 alpha/beta hydrolase [Mesorhizobium sp. M1C.F.Ca.ET.204.01.1.1]TGR35496.1 alpha/beta hydrolase [Mesorhizobium sp. M1C.F.Ca.ET.196.01.1.1]